MKSGNRYYTSFPAMKMRYEEQNRCCTFDAETIPEYEEWKKKIREILRRLIGLNHLILCDLKPHLLSQKSLKTEGIIREKWLIQTEEGVYMPFYLLKPEQMTSIKRPVVIACHGHGCGGKMAPAGVWEIPEVKAVAEKQNYTYGLEMTRRGFNVFCPDARGFGERREKTKQGEEAEQYLKCSCRELSHMATGLGLTVTGLWVWDLMRLLDYIESRSDCLKEKIGCMGLSGGGMQTLWLTALDDRVRFAAVSGYFYGYKDALFEMNNNCSCNYIPGLWNKADMGDIGALIAPRPFVIESGLKDHLNGRRGIKNVLEQVETVKKAYHLFHAEDALIHYIFDGPHKWSGEAVYPTAMSALMPYS